MTLNNPKKVLVWMAGLLVLFLAGCGEVKETQDINYATAVGVDFKDGKYHCYVQFIDLKKVAKTETADSRPPKVWVSKADGTTFTDAFFEVYNTAQERILWAYVTSIVLSESAIKEGFPDIFDGLTRYYEFRLTPWIFGTKESIPDLLSTLGFNDQTSLNTILHKPEGTFQQNSVLKPIQVFKFASHIFEPVYTSYLPSLAINDTQWEQNKKDEPKLEYDGAFFMENDEYKGFYGLNEIKGFRWAIPDMERLSMLVPNFQNPDFLAVFEAPKTKLRAGDSPMINVQVKAKGYVVNRENNSATRLKQMEELTSANIEKEIRELYEFGLKENVDFLNLQHALYRSNWKAWNKLYGKAEDDEEHELLDKITVDVKIKHGGALRNRLLKVKEID